MSALSEPRFAQAAELFGALAAVSRLQILLALGEKERTVGEVVTLTMLSQPLVSQHLRTLRGMRLVRVRRSGRRAYYAVDDAHVLSIVRDGLEHVQEQVSNAQARPANGRDARER